MQALCSVSSLGPSCPAPACPAPQDPSSNSGPAKEVAVMSDRVLHEVLMDTGLLLCIRRVYLLKATGNAGTDPFRFVYVWGGGPGGEGRG